MQKIITDDLNILLDVLPPRVSGPLWEQEDRDELLEVVLDLGRQPEARYPSRQAVLSPAEVTVEDIDQVVARIGNFGEDNRAGIERTLHRISAMRNREGRIIGLSCRVGRAVFGNIKLVQDLVESGKSIMFLGRPGVGKTTMLREAARVIADEIEKRVVIVDTSNEIAGDGDIPHPAIGRARRMQVARPSMQHAVMIEAVENHMPEVIVIDEIGTELEALAARTIAERGVQLVGTAHGNTLHNLIMNPTLSDLIGGIQTVTLGDEEARRRRTRKSILERKAPPTFDVIVEIQSWDRVAIHPDVATVVDAILRGRDAGVEERWFDEDGEVQCERKVPVSSSPVSEHRLPVSDRTETKNIFLFGIDRARLEKISHRMKLPINLVDNLSMADLLMITKNHYRKNPQVLNAAESSKIPVYVIRSNSPVQIEQSLVDLFDLRDPKDPTEIALQETEDAIGTVRDGQDSCELSPQNSFIRRLQHQLIEKHELQSESIGSGAQRKVRVFKEFPNKT
ncbi:MAG: R3H domain-containing nucleic acid-binding protein [Chloroflexota bacterium]|nr:R3H domain-containing nucleic acid-binding protein [Chloroflexota bacterium]